MKRAPQRATALRVAAYRSIILRMNPHVRLPLLGLLGLVFLAPLSVSRAGLLLIVEDPSYTSDRQHPTFDFRGPDAWPMYLSFAFDESYTTPDNTHYDYLAEFNVTQSFARAAGASFGSSEGGEGYVYGDYQGFNRWQYSVVFSLTISDPSIANIVGHTQFDNYGGQSGPFYDPYPMDADPYFHSLYASARFHYSPLALEPEDFMKSLLTHGPMNESLMDSFSVGVSSRRFVDSYSTSSTWYNAAYESYNIKGNDFSAMIVAPEPSTYGIAGVGLLALAAVARGIRDRRRRAA